MYILSTARSTVLSGFPDLITQYKYPHANNETNDFQCFAHKQLYLEINNKKPGLEFFGIKNVSDDKLEIAQLKKVKIDNLYCAAVQKQTNDEIAVGLTNGQIKLINYKTLEFNHTFPTENSRKSILFMDYNASDEYLSSVLEDGKVNIFGIKTKTKLETVEFDKNITLARFHPVKRFSLSAASHKGSVFVYDIQSKRKIFTQLDCHGAPCRDVCMSSAMPDVLISVGFDCLVNIFDTRKKTQPKPIRYDHPLSTGALSDCGNFLCVGNLKGELILYDLRNTKKILTSKKVHDVAVMRIAFVPNKDEKNVSDFNSGNLEKMETFETRKSLAPLDNLPSAGRRDSFCDFLDFQSNKGYDKSRFSTRRESFDWDALNRNPCADDYRGSIDPRISTDRVSGVSDALAGLSSFDGKENVDYDDFGFDSVHMRSSKNDMNPLKDRRNSEIFGRKLKNIEEEKEENENESKNFDKLQSGLNLSNKDIEGCFLKLPADKNSTPNNCKRTLANDGAKNVHTDNDSTNVLKEISNLRNDMNNRFAQLESEIKFNAECNKWHIFTQNSLLWNKQLQYSEEIQDALNVLMQTDPFVNEFVRLKQENEMLKQKLSEK